MDGQFPGNFIPAASLAVTFEGDDSHARDDGAELVAATAPRNPLARLRDAHARARETLSGRIAMLIGFFTILLTILGVLLAAAFLRMAEQSDQAMVLSARALASSRLSAGIAESRYHASRYAALGDPRALAAAVEALEEARRRLDASNSVDDDDAQSRERIDWLRTQVDGFRPELHALEASVSAHGPGVQAAALAQAIDLSGDQLAGQSRQIEDDLTRRALDQRQALRRDNFLTASLALALVLACMAAALVNGRRFSTRVSAALGSISQAMVRVAGGEHTVEIPGTRRSDEIGDMARSLVVFRSAQEKLALAEIHAREAQAALLRRLVGDFEGGLGDVVRNVGAASDRLQLTASGMASAAEQAVGFVDSVTLSMRDAGMGVTAAAAATDEFALSIEEIGRQAASSAGLAQEARHAADSADQTMSALSLAAGEIAQVVELIRSIAQRTNLLALNASIEAARGGEAGRGFAVVASEVKELARQTQVATESVARQISAMQDSTGHSVASLSAIVDQIHRLEANTTAIAQAVEQQSLSSRELARNLDLAAGGVRDIEGSLGQVGAMARDTGEAAAQVLGSASVLKDQARDLHESSRDFLNRVRAA